MKPISNPNIIIQKQEACILSQNALIDQMNEVISIQNEEIDCLKEWTVGLLAENELLKKNNEELQDILNRMLNEQ